MTYAADLASLGLSTGILGDPESLDFIKEIIRLPQNPRILDIGSQGGQLSIRIADLFEADVTGIDSDLTAVELAKSNAKQSTFLGKVNFRHADAITTKTEPEKSYDLVIHRGLEAFIQDKPSFYAKLTALAKNWGYVVNITHTYEGSHDKELIGKLNKAGNMYIEPTSRAELIKQYKSHGLKLVGELSFDIPQPSLLDIGKTPAAKRVAQVLALSAENDKYTSGAVLIFRSQPSILVSDACKG